MKYTISKLLDQQVRLERNQATADRFGASTGGTWQPLATVACKAWWERQSARGPAREEATTTDTVAVAQGGILVPGSTDVTPMDRIAQVTAADGTVLFTGPFQVNAVLPHATYPALKELAFTEPN